MIQWEFAASTSVWDGKTEAGFGMVTPFKIREVVVGKDCRYTVVGFIRCSTSCCSS